MLAGSLWSLFNGIWGVLIGSWGVLASICDNVLGSLMYNAWATCKAPLFWPDFASLWSTAEATQLEMPIWIPGMNLASQDCCPPFL